MKELILVRGVSGSGKNTFCDVFAHSLNIPVYAADDYFMLEGEYKFEILVRINFHDADGNPVLVEIDGEENQPLPGNKSAIESCFEVE